MEQNLPLPELRAPWARICCALLLLMVTWCLLTPHPPQNLQQLQEQTLRGDLVIHLVVFSMVTFFILSLCTPLRRATGLGSAVAFAFITECLQFWVPNRTCDPYDMLANLLGVSFGYGLMISYQQMLKHYGRNFLSHRYALMRGGLFRTQTSQQASE
ncbi:MAG: VanZ family protein [Planctomycetaceae bacterium]|nr:VanZ family protein [Planctomycetaceae bacterium]